ncbi:MAG: cob(I)yrinic acid a,c-diamide adenosyltransferase [Deltaproteobacteria bacterium]|nr:cob(I)yrinic acid a,c-diamide adenosyltransferase [Deltaproteobacteria bacterium]
MSSIYTRSGDQGMTSLLDGTRVPKCSGRVDAYGELDEVCSWIGAARACTTDTLLGPALGFVQHRFYNCASNLSAPPGGMDLCGVRQDDVLWLERAIDRFEQTSGPLDHFVLPGGSQEAAWLHVARTVCRRAERRILELAAREPVDETLRRFVNRASDFLFAAARYANAVSCQGDLIWDRDAGRPELDSP